MVKRIDIELAPKRHVTDAMRNCVAAAFALTDLSEPVWVSMRGDSSHHPSVQNVAPPHLTVRLTPSEEAHAADVVRGVASRLAAALATIRSELPALPIGLEVCSPDTVARLGFRLGDTPDDIRRALAASPSRAELDTLGRWIGWDTIRWVSLNDELAVAKRR